MKWTLITGASSGIGAACAELLAQEKKPLWLLARRQARLETLRETLTGLGCEVRLSVLDVADAVAVQRFGEIESEALSQVHTLINNAGLALGVKPLQEGQLQDWTTMMETNVMGLLRMTRLVLPAMCQRKEGHIVNIGSVAGRWNYPGGNVYCASKSAVHSLSENLRLDLLGTGVRVTEVSPGMVHTEFSEVRLKDKSQADTLYQGFQPLTARDVAEAVSWCLARPAHVNIQELVVYPTAQAAPGQVSRKNPTRP